MHRNWPAGLYALFLVLVVLYAIGVAANAHGARGYFCEDDESFVTCARDWGEALTVFVATAALIVALQHFRTAKLEHDRETLTLLADELSSSKAVHWVI